MKQFKEIHRNLMILKDQIMKVDNLKKKFKEFNNLYTDWCVNHW